MLGLSLNCFYADVARYFVLAFGFIGWNTARLEFADKCAVGLCLLQGGVEHFPVQAGFALVFADANVLGERLLQGGITHIEAK